MSTQKRREGDNQKPFGYYKISKKSQNTRFPKSLLISYPTKKDKHNARVRRIPFSKIGEIFLINGNPYKVSKPVREFTEKHGINIYP